MVGGRWERKIVGSGREKVWEVREERVGSRREKKICSVILVWENRGSLGKWRVGGGCRKGLEV